MGESKIEWTDMTWNPVTGCSKVSTGCKHCYAERLFPRVYGKDLVRVPISHVPNDVTYRQRKFTDVKLHPDRLDAPLHWKKPRMIFVNSMSDLFHEDVPFEFIDEIFHTMAHCFLHTFQILTKRPARMLEYLNQFQYKYLQHKYPFFNVWLGTSIENQDCKDARLDFLSGLPDEVIKFVSLEPLIGAVKLNPIDLDLLDWVIVGGESGPGYRPMKPEWAKSIIEQCQATGVPVFMKQMAGKKEIPEDLKIMEYPKCHTILSE